MVLLKGDIPTDKNKHKTLNNMVLFTEPSIIYGQLLRRRVRAPLQLLREHASSATTIIYEVVCADVSKFISAADLDIKM